MTKHSPDYWVLMVGRILGKWCTRSWAGKHTCACPGARAGKEVLWQAGRQAGTQTCLLPLVLVIGWLLDR